MTAARPPVSPGPRAEPPRARRTAHRARTCPPRRRRLRRFVFVVPADDARPVRCRARVTGQPDPHRRRHRARASRPSIRLTTRPRRCPTRRLCPNTARLPTTRSSSHARSDRRRDTLWTSALACLVTPSDDPLPALRTPMSCRRGAIHAHRARSGPAARPTVAVSPSPLRPFGRSWRTAGVDPAPGWPGPTWALLRPPRFLIRNRDSR